MNAPLSAAWKSSSRHEIGQFELLRQGADPNAKANDGRIPLHMAVEAGVVYQSQPYFRSRSVGDGVERVTWGSVGGLTLVMNPEMV